MRKREGSMNLAFPSLLKQRDEKFLELDWSICNLLMRGYYIEDIVEVEAMVLCKFMDDEWS